MYGQVQGRRSCERIRGLAGQDCLATGIEMILRTSLWSLLWLVRPRTRGEARERLGAYRRILWRTLADRGFWAPRDPRRPGETS